LYEAEFDLSQTVHSVKESLASAHGFDLKKFRLIFKGKALENDVTLEASGVDGTGFITIHISAVSRRPAKPENAPDRTAPPEPAPAPLPVADPAPAPAGPSSEPLPLSAQGPPLPAAWAGRTVNLEAMGFGRQDCEDALRASLGNIDRAAEFLLSGYVPPQPPAPPAADESSESDEVSFDGSDESEDEDDDAVRLRRFTHFRSELIRNPAQLPALLNRMAEEHPALAGLIREDPAAFLGSIGLKAEDFNLEGLSRMTRYEQLMLRFSDAEQRSIRNLEKTGFDTMTIIQVFVACDKNEALTRACLQSM
jgi:UV excision repair protein RAD23